MVVEHAHGLRQRRGPNAKSSLHKAHLAPDAGLQAPGASLSFAQGSHDFESLDRGIGRGDRFETAHRLDQYLELSVIGLDHVIEILHLPVGRLPVQLSFALQFGDRCTIARRFVGIERGRLFPVLQASQGLAQEPLRCLGAAGRRQVEIDRVAPLVDCPVQVGPLAPHLDVGFIQAPARIKATPPEPAQPLLHLRGVALDPAIDRRMVDRNAAFRQHFLKVAIADRIATIPAHRPQDHITLEMAPLEIRHRSVRPISAKHAQASRFLQQSLSDARFMTLLWKTIKAGHIDVGLFRAASEGVPQGGVISPLLSNIMLNEFDQYLHERYLSGKARKDRWYWNNSIQRGRSTAVRENWQWKPAVAYCRYADDFVLIVKGTKAQAEAIREECRGVLEGSLKLRLNMDKTKITHVNDGFIFLGHRIIRKRSRYGEMRVVSTIPQEKARNFAASLTALLSGNYSESKVDMAEQLNRKLKGWAMFYQFVDFKAKVFSYIDRVVFWKLAHWLARKYRTGIASLMRWWCKSPKPGQSKTWVLFGKTNHGKLSGEILYWLVGQGKKLFRWRLPEGNPYLRTETRNTYTSRFTEVAMAFASI